MMRLSLSVWVLAVLFSAGTAMDAELAKTSSKVVRAVRSSELHKRQAPDACGSTYSSMLGTIQSENYPNDYTNNHECDWTIIAAQGQTIELTFENPFRLEIPLSDGDCYADELEIYNDGPYGTLIDAVCGKTKPGRIVSNSNVMYLRFHTDGSLGFAGFRANYRFVGGTGDCGTVFTDNYGVITSPNYPQDYPNNLECEWAIVAPPGQQVGLSFDENYRIEIPNFSGYCYADRLEIFEGITSSPPATTVCGREVPDEYLSDSNILSLRFKTDSSLGFKGFRINYFFTEIFNKK